MEPGTIDLMKNFGRHNIAKHAVFFTALASTDFLRHYALNKNKSTKQTNHSGNVRVWGCESELCSWQVTLTKKRSTQRENTKLAFCPDNSWFVCSIQLIHSSSCDSVRKCSSKILVELSGFKGAIAKKLNSARARVTSSVKQMDNVNVDQRSALVYKAIARVKKMMETEVDKYDKLLSFLRSFARENPGIFLAIGALVQGKDNWSPLLECDTTHMKRQHYIGLWVLLVGKDDQWMNIPVYVSFIHKETVEHRAKELSVDNPR
ncbi:hypothetical protein PHMEG_0008781 [Phytophthora megakarya]|uniref:Uncharacterized protein n=1 Tax=Phytophthora megakarya TaxID=4795 RepID=A0A225WIM8_9STRA|nr:hypothetical protein PHMEG_0008781 [Phytophthora megakarya]